MGLGFKGRASRGSQRGHCSPESCGVVRDGGREGQGYREICRSPQAAGGPHLLAWPLAGKGYKQCGSASVRKPLGLGLC